MNPFISIIVPVYNVEPYLKQCLDSILNWKFSDWEAILVDDGSEDKSGEICEDYAIKDSRFRVIHQSNGGVSRARNVALDIARGTWCWFVDSDDFINIDTPVNMDILSDSDIVVFDILTFCDGTTLLFEERRNISFDKYIDINKFYDKVISYSHQTYWYHHKFWRKDGNYSIRFSENIALGEDLEFMRKCELLSNHPIKINYTNYYYRLRAGSACRNSHTKFRTIQDAFKVLDNLIHFVSDNGIAYRPGLLKRFINFATTIPANSLATNTWDKSIQVAFRKAVDKFEQTGYNLTTSPYIWLATRMPWLLKHVVNFRNLIKGGHR